MTKDSRKPYEPNSMAYELKTIFGVLWDNGIPYSLSRDFNFQGGFHSVLKKFWAQISAVQPEFGSRPNLIVVELEDEEAINNAIDDGRIDVLNNITLLQAAHMKDFRMHYGLCGNTEMKLLHWSCFSFGPVRSGPLKGHPYVAFDQAMGDKTRKLDLCNPQSRAGERKIWYVHNPNTPKDLFWKISLYRDLCPPSQVRFFCHRDRKQTALARSQAELGFGALEKVTAAPSVERGNDHSR